VTWPFDRERYWVGLFFRKIAVVTATLNPLWHSGIGTMPENRRRPCVVVSNHESFTDILLISHLPWEMKWLSKIEMLRIPVLGWIMRIAGDIPVERGTRVSAAKAMRRCLEVLRSGMSIIIFPEGTRSTTGELLPFKDGAFRLAIDAGVPILPLVVRGTSTALPKHGWRVGRSDAEVRVLPPVDTAGLGHKDIQALKDRVHQPGNTVGDGAPQTPGPISPDESATLVRITARPVAPHREMPSAPRFLPASPDSASSSGITDWVGEALPATP
jgi:1-acyl-sn-glycerol-3-phosphate acyltransferase